MTPARAVFLKNVADGACDSRASSPGAVMWMRAGKQVRKKTGGGWMCSPQPGRRRPNEFCRQKSIVLWGPKPAGGYTFQSILIGLPRENLISRTPFLYLDCMESPSTVGISTEVSWLPPAMIVSVPSMSDR